jgi:hypothetical protein
MLEIIRLVDEANTAHGFQIQRGANDRSCVLRSGFVSMGVGWHQPIFNLVCDYGPDECYLRVAGYIVTPAGSTMRINPRGKVEVIAAERSSMPPVRRTHAGIEQVNVYELALPPRTKP